MEHESGTQTFVIKEERHINTFKVEGQRIQSDEWIILWGMRMGELIEDFV